MMYSRAFDICQICPEDTFSRSGDITCTRCPPNHYAPQRSAACFSSNRVGGILRLDAPFDDFPLDDWRREVAIMLDTEPRFIEILLTRPGSVIVYFDILNPTSIDREDSAIRKLSGNEKMLLFYQWWLTGDDRIKAMSTDIIDFKTYSYRLRATANGGVEDDVITLFQSSPDTKQPIVPARPVEENGVLVNQPAYSRQETFYFTLSVNDVSAAPVRSSLPALLFALVAAFFFLL
jgi:hypothetical protein